MAAAISLELTKVQERAYDLQSHLQFVTKKRRSNNKFLNNIQNV